jgi:hypothetical protein
MVNAPTAPGVAINKAKLPLEQLYHIGDADGWP